MQHTIILASTSVTAALDLAELLPSHRMRVLRIAVTTNRATSEQLRLTGRRVSGAPTSGSGGATPTPTAHDPSAQGDAGFTTVETFNTTRLSGGTQVTLLDRWFSVVGGFEWVAADMDQGRWAFDQSTRFVLGLETAPSAATSIAGEIVVDI